MGCNCKSVETIISLVILLVALVWWGVMWAQWVVVIATILLLIHALTCKKCSIDGGMKMEMSAPKKKVSRKK